MLMDLCWFCLLSWLAEHLLVVVLSIAGACLGAMALGFVVISLERFLEFLSRRRSE